MPSLPDSLTGPLGMVLLAVCAVGILVTLLRGHMFRTASARDLTREQRARLRDQVEIRDQIAELMAQLEQTAQRSAEQIDAKLAEIKKALTTADERLERLAEAEPVAVKRGTANSARVRSDTVRASEPMPLAPRKPLTPLVAAADPRRAQVWHSLESGQSTAQIAEQLKMPLGEVELLANLHDFVDSAPRSEREAPASARTVSATSRE